jgi:hypothetical protein
MRQSVQSPARQPNIRHIIVLIVCKILACFIMLYHHCNMENILPDTILGLGKLLYGTVMLLPKRIYHVATISTQI